MPLVLGTPPSHIFRLSLCGPSSEVLMLCLVHWTKITHASIRSTYENNIGVRQRTLNVCTPSINVRIQHGRTTAYDKRTIAYLSPFCIEPCFGFSATALGVHECGKAVLHHVSKVVRKVNLVVLRCVVVREQFGKHGNPMKCHAAIPSVRNRLSSFIEN